MTRQFHDTKGILIVLVAFIMLGLAASIINPLHEATDELRHYRFVRFVATKWALPVQGELGCSVQGHHPPLFYLLGAAATAWIDTGRDICYTPPTNPFWNYRQWEVGVDNKNQYLHGVDEKFPWHGEALAAHIARAVNVFIGAGVVLITWLIGRAIWPEKPALALGGVAFIAFNPMFVYMSGAINNDVIAAFSGSAITLACVRLLRDENGLSRRWGFTLGILYSLALMSKFNLAAIALLIEATVTWVAWRKRQWRGWWLVNSIILFTVLIIAGWWFIRNQIIYGEPTGFQRLTELWGVRNPAESWGVAIFELPYAWTTLWGRFGYGQIPLPDSIYIGLRWVTGIAFLGLLIPFITRKSEYRRMGPPILLLGLNVLLFFAVLFSYLLVSPAGPMGRFFFPALPSLSILIFLGLTRWKGLLEGSKIKRKGWASLTSIVALAANLGMMGLTLIALIGFLAPAYAKPQSFTDDTAVPNPVNAQFDSLVNLRGYQIDKTSVHPGGFIDIDLYWEVTGRPPGNYLLFVHLIDEAETIVAQRDTHPGLGNFPSNQWLPGDRFIESIRLFLPETAYSPTTAELSIGLYAPESYRLGITNQEKVSLGDALVLGSVEISPLSTEYPNPLDLNFNNEARLIGYEYDRRELYPGDDLMVTLYWEALDKITADYIVQVHLTDETGTVWATADSRPQSDQQPTNHWVTSQHIVDPHTLVMPSDLPSGSYGIHVALIDYVRKEAQNIVAEDGHWIDNRLLLAKVRMQQ